MRNRPDAGPGSARDRTVIAAGPQQRWQLCWCHPPWPLGQTGACSAWLASVAGAGACAGRSSGRRLRRNSVGCGQARGDTRRTNRRLFDTGSRSSSPTCRRPMSLARGVLVVGAGRGRVAVRLKGGTALVSCRCAMSGAKAPRAQSSRTHEARRRKRRTRCGRRTRGAARGGNAKTRNCPSSPRSNPNPAATASTPRPRCAGQGSSRAYACSAVQLATPGW